MATGERLLGGKLPERRLHSVASLAKENGLNRITLRHLLTARDIIPRDGKHHVFDAAAGEEVAAAARNLVHIIGLPKVLNCSRPQAAGLLNKISCSRSQSVRQGPQAPPRRRSMPKASISF